MSALAAYLSTFIQNSDIVDLVLACLVIVLASNILGALGFDLLNRR